MFFRVRSVIIRILLSCCFLAAMDSLAQPTTTAGIEGEIRIGPARPGPAKLGGPNTQPLMNTVFIVKQEEKIVASFQTDNEGRFRISLPPGKYRVSKKDWKGRFGSYGPFEVKVIAGEIKKVQWECDNGMQ
jgi:hypothetical protein